MYTRTQAQMHDAVCIHGCMCRIAAVTNTPVGEDVGLVAVAF